MGLYRRGKTWWMAYTLDGHQKCETTGTSSKRLAQKILDVRRAEIVEGRHVSLLKSQAPTLKDYAEQFLETVRHPNTLRRYRSSKANLESLIGDARLPHVTAARIEEYKHTRLAAGVKGATINRDLSFAAQILRRAERERYIARSPFETADLFLEERKERRQPHILTREEEKRLLAVAPPHLRTLIVLLVETGLRSGSEALPLRWEDVDFLDGTIYVRRSKTLAGRRSIPLSDFCKAELSRWRRLCGPAVSPYVFFNPRNPATYLQKVPKTWAHALKKAGLGYFPLYNLRATFATRLSAAGVPDVLAAQILGHSDASILHVYSKAPDEYRRAAIDKLDAHRDSTKAEQGRSTKCDETIQ